MKRFGLTALAVCAALVASAATSDVSQEEAPLLSNGDLALRRIDFEAYMQRVPAHLRNEFRAEFEKINPTVDTLWVRRVLAVRARAAGMDKDPLLIARMRLAEEELLAEAYIEDVGKRQKYPDLTGRALELYKANEKQFATPELFKLQHILIANNDKNRERGRAAAAERAQKVLAEVKEGKEEFGALAARYSDDPSKSRELPAAPATSFERPIPDVLAKATVPGEIIGPIETRYGFHIFKLVQRVPPRIRAFDEVKETLIEREKVRISDESKAAVVDSIRGDPKTHVFTDNIRGLKSDFKVPASVAAETPTNVRY